MYEDQVLSTENKPGRATNNYHTIISKNAACQEQMLEDILNLKPINPEMFSDIFEFSNVERKLERMFAAETAVSSLEEDHICEYEKKNRIKESEESIEFRNNAYCHVVSHWDDRNKITTILVFELASHQRMTVKTW